MVNKSPIEIRVSDKPFHPNDNGLNCTHGLAMMK